MSEDREGTSGDLGRDYLKCTEILPQKEVGGGVGAVGGGIQIQGEVLSYHVMC